METQTTNKNQQLVWAKVNGYPWWPAIIANQEVPEGNQEGLILVNFIGHNSHSYLSKEKMKNYHEFYNEFSKTKNPLLLKAISYANDLKMSLVTFEEQKTKCIKTMKKQMFSQNFPSHKIRKTNSSIKACFKMNKSQIRSSEERNDCNYEMNLTQETFNLEEIISTNPFQRISRSLIKELHIKTTINSTIKKEKIKLPKSKIYKKLPCQSEKKDDYNLNQQTNIDKPIEKNSNSIQKVSEKNDGFYLSQQLHMDKPIENKCISIKKSQFEKKEYFEKKLENCLFKLTTKKSKNVISLISKLLDSYHDYNFSGEELFKSNIPKICKTMYSMLKDVKSQHTESEFTKIQLESILNHITEKVINELLNNKNYMEKLVFQTCKMNEIDENSDLQNQENPIKSLEFLKKSSEQTTTSTTTTTIQKPKTEKKTLIKKKEELKKKSVKKPNLRKKICLKLARILQNNYLAEKVCSQNLSLSIEGNIRNEFPLMNKDYKTYIKMIFCILKRKKLNFDQLKDMFLLDFKHIGPILKELNHFEYEENGEKNCAK